MVNQVIPCLCVYILVLRVSVCSEGVSGGEEDARFGTRVLGAPRRGTTLATARTFEHKCVWRTLNETRAE